MKYLTLILLLTLNLAAQTKYDLESRFSTGDKYEVNYTTDQSVTQTLGNNEMKTKQSQGTVYNYEVTDIDSEGTATLKYTYKQASIVIKSANAMMNVDYDSKRDGLENVPPAAMGVSALVGQSFFVKISKGNKVTEVKGMNKLIDLMLKKVGTALPAAAKNAMEAQFKKSFGNESMKSMIQLMFDNTPGKPVAVGEKWKSKMKLNTMYTMNLDNDYEFKELKGNAASIAVNSIIKSDKDAGMEINGMKITPDLQGTQSGVNQVDITNGQLIKSVINQDIKGSIGVGGMTIPMSILTKVTINAKKL